MPKTKPSWVCQSCTRPFTTKYSLMRHFKRFPDHAPPNLNDGSQLRPVTVVVDENNRTVQVVPIVGGSSAKTEIAPYPSHPHGTRQKHGQKYAKYGATEDNTDTTTTEYPAYASQQNMLPVVEETPSPTEFGSPAPNSSASHHHTDNPYLYQNGSGQFPFLPPFLEDEQILDIATPLVPQQQQHATPSSNRMEPQSPLSAHYSWIFSKDTTTAEHGSSLLSPLAPACNYGQVFSDEEEEKLHRLTKQHQQSQQQKKQPGNPHPQRSPVELAALDKSLLLGDHEATSPFTFLEKTSSLAADPMLPSASLDFLSPTRAFTKRTASHRHNGAATSTTNTSAVENHNRLMAASASVSLEDLDFGFAF